MFKEISEETISELENHLSFQGKNFLLTLAFPKGFTTSNICEKLVSVQHNPGTMRNKNKGKIIVDMIQNCMSCLYKNEAVYNDGGILFAGVVRTTSGTREYTYTVVTPLIRGYEEYFQGQLETRFFISPLKKHLKLMSKKMKKTQKKILSRSLAEIEKEISHNRKKVVVGIASAIKAVSKSKAERIVISETMKNFISCEKCGVIQELGCKKCSVCKEDIPENLKNCYDELTHLCKKTNVDYISFKKDIAKAIDTRYYSVVCFLRYDNAI